MQKINKKEEDYFEILGQKILKEGFPNIYEIYQKDPKWAEAQILSVAKAWHEGRISPAIVSLEMDMAHM